MIEVRTKCYRNMKNRVITCDYAGQRGFTGKEILKLLNQTGKDHLYCQDV